MRKGHPRSEALALLGLAQRAGAVVKGAEATREAVRRGSAHLVVLAADGAQAQQKKVLASTLRRGIPLEKLGSMIELGRAVGAGPLLTVAVTERGVAAESRKRLGRDRVDG
jgi:ribosomal protein L7Ae-like RNA K-turn-binding protein